MIKVHRAGIKICEQQYEGDTMHGIRRGWRQGARDVVKQILKLTACSDLRRGVLLNLIDGKKSLRELREALNTSSTTALHAIRELERVKLIYRDEMHEYELTETGRIIAKKILDIADTSEVLKKHERFWAEHDLSGIPENLLEKIGWLKKSEVVRLDTLDISRRTFYNVLEHAEWVKGATSVFSYDYPNVFLKPAVRVPVQLILTREVLRKLENLMGEDNLKNVLRNYNVDIYITEEHIKVPFVVTDSYLSLGLFLTEGVFDSTSELISTDQKAIKWALLLFSYYMRNARKYKPLADA